MSFFAAKLMAAHTPRTRQLAVAAGAAFERGALLVRDSNGAWAECGADPTSIGGVAETAYGADTSGFSRTGKREFPPGYMQATLVGDEQLFLAKYVGTLPAADGGTYGVVRDTDGQWKVDFAEVTTMSVRLQGRRTNGPENIALVYVTFLPAVVQIVA